MGCGASEAARPILWMPYRREAAVAVYQKLLEWARKYPALIRSRDDRAILWTSLMTAYTFDGGIDQTAHEFAAQCLTWFLYDDVVDDRPGIADSTTAALLAIVAESTGPLPQLPGVPGAETTVREQVISAFSESMIGPIARSRSPQWAQTFRGIVDTTLRGHLLSANWGKAGRQEPSLEEHLANGSYTAGAPILLVGAAMATVSTRLSEADSSAYFSACLDLGWCVRAANDIAGIADDLASGQINAVSLATRETSSSAVECARQMLCEASEKIAAMHAVASDPAHPLAQQYRWLVNCTTFHVDWYLTKTGYSFTVEDWVAFDTAGNEFSDALLKAVAHS
jgi:hypothetical protein